VLNIENTDINKGMEFLPNSIRIIHYSTQERPSSKLTGIVEQLDSRLEEKVSKVHNDRVKSRTEKNYLFAHSSQAKKPDNLIVGET
jgi:hypothetical protein